MSVIGAVILLASFIPDWHAGIAFWLGAIRWTVPRLASPWGRGILIVLGMGMIWLDLRRIMGKSEAKPLDESTLRGRTLKLRDEMQQFLDTTPSSDEGSGTIRIDYLERSSGSSLRVVKLRFGYFSRFSAHVNQIFNEFGERNLRDVRLAGR